MARLGRRRGDKEAIAKALARAAENAVSEVPSSPAPTRAEASFSIIPCARVALGITPSATATFAVSEAV